MRGRVASASHNPKFASVELVGGVERSIEYTKPLTGDNQGLEHGCGLFCFLARTAACCGPCFQLFYVVWQGPAEVLFRAFGNMMHLRATRDDQPYACQWLLHPSSIRSMRQSASGNIFQTGQAVDAALY